MNVLEKIKKDTHLQVQTFTLSSPQTRLAFQASAAVIVAIFLAVLLQTQEPYWAGISAFISTQPTVGNTLSKSLERAIGTILGAAAALLIISLFITSPPLFSVAIFFLAFIGIYLTFAIEEKTYTWLFFYVTGLMILLASLNNPTPENFINTAFFRSLEIIIGVFSSCIISLCFTTQYAHKQLIDSLIKLINLLIKLNDTNMQYISLIAQPKSHNQHEQEKIQQDIFDTLKAISTHQIKQDQLLIFAQHEIKSKKQHEQLISLLTNIRNITSIVMDTTRHQYLSGAFKSILKENEHSKMLSALNQFHTPLSEILNTIKVALTSTTVLSVFEKTTQSFINENLTTIKISMVQLKSMLFKEYTNPPETVHHHIHSKLIGYEWFQSLKSIQNETKKLALQSNVGKAKTHDSPEFKRHISDYFKYDPYYFKHAIIGAAAILFVPFIWLYFNLPGYYQIAVSIAVCFNLSSDISRDKGLLRIAGCLIGSIISLFVLTLSLDSFPLILAILFGVIFSFGLLHFSNTDSMSLGTQANVVFIIGVINQLTPNTSLVVPLERLGGIFLGVSSVIIFQALFWPYQQQDKIKHTYTLLLTQFNQNLAQIFSHKKALNTANLWDSQGAYNLRSLKRHLIAFINLNQDNHSNKAAFLSRKQTPLRLYYSIFHFLMIKEDPYYTEFVQSQDKNKSIITETYKLLSTPLSPDEADDIMTQYSEIEAQLITILKEVSPSKLKNRSNTAITPNAFYLSLLNICSHKHTLLKENTLYLSKSAQTPPIE
ncbi:FUSC family protein [uncultured Shewanella sp.]|uniref:FUSC family protein n=1 Tax=uncultured Shewanella sp. TaxID=173975 RepID=UPI00262F4661|nr:FUSC family protein [uncultured Shewanella sp.]